MANRQIALELLLGKKVRDTDGKLVGHIEEIRAKRQGKDWVIDHYEVGLAALLERLAALTVAEPLLKLIRREKRPGGYIVPWDKLDLSDPEHPRVLGRKDDLETME